MGGASPKEEVGHGKCHEEGSVEQEEVGLDCLEWEVCPNEEL